MKSIAALHPGSTRVALPAIPLFSQLADELLTTVAEAGTAARFEAGEIVFRDGDPGDCLYSVLSGELRAFKRLEDGSILELGRLSPGDSFGELALLDGGLRSNTVVALTRCHVFRLGRDAFLAVLPDSPRLFAAVLGNLVAHVRAGTEHLLREELEQRVVRAEMELERHRALTQMVAGVAHEINTPLGIVNTAASLVKKRIGSDRLTRAVAGTPARAALDDVREAVDLIEANITRAHRLIRNFKQLSVSQMNDVKELLSIVDVIDDAVQLFSINARQANLTISVSNDLPDDGAETWLGYRGFLTQILLNLLTNVERYGYPDTGGLVEILVSDGPRDAETHFTVTVRDFGCGMPAEAVSRVFEPFYTTGRSKGGTGLGMAIVHNLVTAALKGQVSVESETGRGTAVTITFPKIIPD
jgi:signal transduction histidine kinase